MKQRLVQDDSSHWYCIPADKRDEFEKWAYADEDDAETEVLEDFDEYRLNMHISNYTFDNFEEDR